MRTLIDFSILQEYNENVLTRGDKLSAISKLVNWNVFLPIVNSLYRTTQSLLLLILQLCQSRGTAVKLCLRSFLL